MDINDVINLLDDPDFNETGSSYYQVELPFEIKPNEFLAFAEKDLESQSMHKDINALSNAKRALDCQLDSLLFAFGLYKIAQSGNWNFPRKIEMIKELGIVAPRVLGKINNIRNLMEHEFVKPNSDQVTDFIDIVSLFFAATSRYMNYFNDSCSYEVSKMKDENKYQIISGGEIEMEDGRIKFRLIKYIDNRAQEPETFEISNIDSDYIKVLSKYLKVTQKY